MRETCIPEQPWELGEQAEDKDGKDAAREGNRGSKKSAQQWAAVFSLQDHVPGFLF